MYKNGWYHICRYKRDRCSLNSTERSPAPKDSRHTASLQHHPSESSLQRHHGLVLHPHRMTEGTLNFACLQSGSLGSTWKSMRPEYPIEPLGSERTTSPCAVHVPQMLLRPVLLERNVSDNFSRVICSRFRYPSASPTPLRQSSPGIPNG